MGLKHFPRATYRLQLNSEFGFAETIACLDYFNGLGISHLYLSPFLQATVGSTHGYDVVDHSLINVEIGGREGFDKLCEKLAEKKMGIILDIVPNHMAISGPENPWWWDVLENGPASQYSRYFDVDWHMDSEHNSNLILLPILGDHYGIVLEKGELKVKYHAGLFTLNYHEHVFPIAPRSISIVLERAYEKSGTREFGFLACALQQLPHASSQDFERIQRRQRDKAVLYDLLVDLCVNYPAVSAVIDEAVDEINNDFDLLDVLIGRQSYKLAYWKLSKYQVGYRRFFNINSLVGLRMEDVHAFNDSHRLVINLEKEGKIDGFRVDHPDGLYDPTNYFGRLRRACPDAHILAEKILEPGEALNPDWQISGTTGYDFLNLVNGVFVDAEGFKKLVGYWREISGDCSEFKELVYQKKKKIITDLLGSEISRLASDLVEICENHRRYRDFASLQLYAAVGEVAANMSVYRTYTQPETGKLVEKDRLQIINAISSAKANLPELGDYIFDFIAEILLLNLRGEREDRFVMRFQQFTGPVMAKSIEDTVFYIYNPLTSLNEVGGNPGNPFVSVSQFHQWCEFMAKNWPLTMLAGSTHDTKRSEDVRARLNYLSMIPRKWFNAVKRWLKINVKYKTDSFPDANTEYFFYQTLVGTWPIAKERIVGYMQKAVREAKVFTNWTDPNEVFENSLITFIDGAFADTEFINSLEAFVKALVIPGHLISLSQLTLRLTAPGFPDIYQGTESWDNSLADPDNRRPVDFSQKMKLLKKLENKDCGEIMHFLEEGLPKLFIIKSILELRRQVPSFNQPDSYKPINALGECSEDLIAFMRGNDVLVIVPCIKLNPRLCGSGDRIIIPEGQWCDIFSRSIFNAGSAKVKDLLKNFPVAVLVKVKEKEVDWA